MEQEHDVQNDFHEKKPDLSWPTVKRYLVNRIPTLKPPPWQEKKHLVNPWPAVRQITGRQWLFILVGMSGWLVDSIDYFALPLTTAAVAETFDKSVSDVSWGITLVLMLRSVGAVIFGLLGDRYGRKWPFIINCALFIVLEICSGFAQTYEQFLGIRALFGIAMGGIYGNASATSLEDCPVDARGFISGLFQECYALGNLLCTLFDFLITNRQPHSWRALFWFCGSLGVLPIIFRLCLPETDAYMEQKRLAAQHEEIEQTNASQEFVIQGKKAVKTHWLVFIYLILFMTAQNFSSHGSQDLFPTRLETELGFSPTAKTVTNCIANLGALSGGIIMGHASEFVGRRLMMLIGAVIGGALIYPWGFVQSRPGINASAFFMQFAVQGIWGCVPIYISELSPPRFRAFIVGTSYQLGNLASSAASTIESTIGERFPILDDNGKPVPGEYEYGRVMAILMGAVFAYMFVVVVFGPENRNADLSGVTAEEGNLQKQLDAKLSIEHAEDAEHHTVPAEKAA